MAVIPREFRYFKGLFIATTVYSIVASFGLEYFQVSLDPIAAGAVATLGTMLYIAMLGFLYRTSQILRWNGVIAIRPWVLIVVQLLLTGRLIFPGIIVPIYIWVKSAKLLKLDTVKTYDEKKFELPLK